MARPQRVVSCLVLLLVLLGSTGCLRLVPKKPTYLSSTALIYSVSDLNSDISTYRKFTPADAEAAKILRNRIVFRIMSQIEAAYGDFENRAFYGRATANTLGDAAQLGVTSAAVVVGASGVKDILNATSAALAGTRISVDKNFFEQKATEALLAQMRASRRTLKNQLLLNLNKQDVAHYPLDEAFSDLTDYYYAGTISSALVEVANKAGADAKAAKDQLDATVLTLAQATPDQTATALKLRATYSQIKADLAAVPTRLSRMPPWPGCC